MKNLSVCVKKSSNTLLTRNNEVAFKYDKDFLYVLLVFIIMSGTFVLLAREVMLGVYT